MCSLKYPLLLPFYSKACILYTVFGKDLEYQIFWKFFYSDNRCSMRMWGRTDRWMYRQPLQT